MSYMEKRSYERIEAIKAVRIFYRSRIYPATTLNLSEKGVFIDTRRWFPANIMCAIDIHIGDEFLKVLARVKHVTKINSYCSGIGAELLNPSKEYVAHVKVLKRSSDILL